MSELTLDALAEMISSLRDDLAEQASATGDLSRALLTIERKLDTSAPTVIRLSDREACIKHLGYAPSYVRQLAREKGAPVRSPGHGSVQIVILSEWVQWISKMRRVV